MINDFNDFNYLEINLISPEVTSQQIDLNKNLNITDINWNQKIFNKTLFDFMDKHKLKPFERKFRVLKHYNKNLIYSINDNKYNVNTKEYVSHINNNKYIMIKYNKDNIPPINFPSTKNIHEIYHINKIVFKITNRIYINFELKKKIINDKYEIYRRLYINLNNDKKNLDNNDINDILSKTLNYFN